MRAVDIIVHKRDGETLSNAQIEWFIGAYLRDEVSDYQASAFLMAVFLRGMNFDETAALTRAMMASGEMYDLAALGIGRTVDKHSTGGVGDKVSLVLAPLVAACGVPVPMVSGRGLGHTGGTLDKLESIPGFQVRLDSRTFMDQLARIGVAMIGQSDTFVPADRRLYALRDVTGTIESIPLICASIMSKKVASGAQAFVMDVKTGSGAFMPTMERAVELARGLIGVGAALDSPVHALITDMSQPLGQMVGNSIEVIEAIDCLHGRGPADLRELTLALAAEMLLLGDEKGVLTGDEARNTVEQALDSGRAMQRFHDMVTAQGGDPRCIDKPERLDVSKKSIVIDASADGHVQRMDCREIGNAAVVLGAGRARAEDAVDPGVGIEVLVRLGDRIARGQPLFRVFHRDRRGLDDCTARLERAVRIGDEPVTPPPLIHRRTG